MFEAIIIVLAVRVVWFVPGQIPLKRYLTTFKLGDYVDLRGDGAIHKGMPHKFYHGRTGIVWNVTPRAVGVIVRCVGCVALCVGCECVLMSDVATDRRALSPSAAVVCVTWLVRTPYIDCGAVPLIWPICIAALVMLLLPMCEAPL